MSDSMCSKMKKRKRLKRPKPKNYKCIVDGLKGNKGAAKIAECPDLKKWGTGGGVTRVLKTKKINPPVISTSEVKTVNESFNYETKRISDLIKKDTNRLKKNEYFTPYMHVSIVFYLC